MLKTKDGLFDHWPIQMLQTNISVKSDKYGLTPNFQINLYTFLNGLISIQSKSIFYFSVKFDEFI